MAIEQLPTKLPRELSSHEAVISAEAVVLPIERRDERPRASASEWPSWLNRLLEMVPGSVALFLISSIFWGYAWFPRQIAVALIAFDAYWLWKSWTIAYHVVKGTRLIRHFQAQDWKEQYRFARARGEDVLPWDEIRHVVLVPNYKESVEKLRDTLEAMARAEAADETVIPVLAMEAADPEARDKADVLLAEFAGRFRNLLVTYHPYGLVGEVRGKSSNEAWAARRAVEELVDRDGLDIDLLTVTSCDADTQFPKQYFQCLRYKFATDPNRYRRFWQAPIFFYNNIWQVPAALRVPNAIGGLVHLSRLSRSPQRRVLFSQSTYSLSMRMAHDVGYWDTDVIPEDWHMFLKCFYSLEGKVDVEPIYLPIGNDGALSHGLKRTLVNQYMQVRRWAWGATDIPIYLQEAVRRREIPALKRYLRFWYLCENHLMWSTQWWFITLGGLIPTAYHIYTGHYIDVPQWLFLKNLTGLAFIPTWISVGSLFLTPCMLPYLMLVVWDLRLRPPAPATVTKRRHALHLLAWCFISPITFLFSALPALDSQVRLLLGRRMEYRVTEKV